MYLDAGLPVSSGTDAPVVPYPPLWTIYHFVTRDTITGGVLGADQTITREQALRIATINNAWLTMEEHDKGSIEPGKLADLVVLSEDPLTCPPSRAARRAGADHDRRRPSRPRRAAMTPSATPVPSPLGERFAGLHRLIGNTPLLAVDVRYRGEPRVIYAKQESLNLTGSIKDRMALHILEERLSRRAPSGPAIDRRGDQRQHRHLVRGDRPRARPSGDDLHAGLDEPRAHVD